MQLTDEYRPLDALKPHPRNYNRHSPAQVNRFAEQIRHSAFTAPFVIRPDGTVLAGHRRRLGLLKLRADSYPEPVGVLPGWQVPCRVVECNEVQALAILTGDNPDPGDLDYDTQGLASILAELEGAGALLASGYDGQRLESLISSVSGAPLDLGGNPGSAGAGSGLTSPPPPAGIPPAVDETLLGYAIARDGIDGRALLDQRKQRGMELVKRLKDAEGELPAEVEFWAEQLAAMVRQHASRGFTLVTCPPSSGKRSAYLAGALAETVADRLELPFCVAFTNPAPRGNRANVAAKLEEEREYGREAETAGESILLVDDAYCTGRTLARCAKAAPEARLWLAVLCRS